MKEILRTNDPVLLSALQAALAEADIEPLVFDAYTSIAEGSLGVLPRRLMVADEDAWRAESILRDLRSEAGE
ncbi:DUF2007 domain-containing protein [Caenispirillum salinarum]|uniref:putative signal transducing protein n=1 Tax=Caenispirillum salinarum TaxID=859058 RepID=UPI00384BCA6C